MRLIIWIALFAGWVSARPSLSLLQPLPKHYDAGDAAVVFIKDRMNVLPEGFGHNKEGTITGCRANEQMSLFLVSVWRINESRRS